MNTPIQGTAADLIKIAMVRTAEALKREGLRAQLILQVHDELIVDAAPGGGRTGRRAVKREMENAVHMQVPADGRGQDRAQLVRNQVKKTDRTTEGTA